MGAPRAAGSSIGVNAVNGPIRSRVAEGSLADEYKKILELLDADGHRLHTFLTRLTRREDVVGGSHAGTGDPAAQIAGAGDRSGYVRSIADKEERGRKLRMVLENLSHQTGLSFSIEQRLVPVWRAIEDVASR